MTPPQQRKKPVKRAFQGRLVGMQESPADPPVAASPAPLKPQRGRKRQYANDAEKQKAYRHRNLVAELMKICRRMQPDIFAKEDRPEDIARAVERRVEEQKRLRKLHDDLLALSLKDLQNLFRLWKETPDTHGRLHNERSGESDRRHGMSELERIIAAQYSDKNRVTPEGPGATPFEQDKDNDKADLRRPGGGRRIPPEHIAYLDDRENIIGILVRKYTRAEGTGLRCLLCQKKVPATTVEGERITYIDYPVFIQDPSDARQHFWEEYEKGLQLFYRYQELSEDPGVVELAPFIVNDVRKAYLNHKHLQAVWRVSQEQ